jgi:muramoyltetrapeptide carboxypeptidase
MPQKLTKPPRLKKGDTIALVSPSSPLAGHVPHRVKAARNTLEKLGFKISIGKNALKVTDYTAGTPRERADDLNAAFADKTVKAIICFIGGNHANQVVPLLDYDLIRANPKIVSGYSDATVLHHALRAGADLETYYGPAALTQFAENPTILPYTWEHFAKATMSAEPIGKISPSAEWTDEVLDWKQKLDLKGPRKLKPNPGFTWLKPGAAKGPLLGGCIGSLQHLRGTPYWPDFAGSLFFWEISEDEVDYTTGDSIANVDGYLADLTNSGMFRHINGMIIGRPFAYSDEQLKKMREIVAYYFDRYNFPILYGADIGHSDPMITVPMGRMAAIDSTKNLFEIS